jgi:hypothetical protein
MPFPNEEMSGGRPGVRVIETTPGDFARNSVAASIPECADAGNRIANLRGVI